MNLSSEPGRQIAQTPAGFTQRFRPASLGIQDDRRSRGVYLQPSTTPYATPGSPPLARGLPPSRGVITVSVRIIPARAGFTTCRRPGSRSRPDHPRSRGVYFGQARPPAYSAGSSPLARGLRDALPPLPSVVGIIPARAGFTRAAPYALRQRGDHPRSRGVYPYPAGSPRLILGSSPLARGLPTVTSRGPTVGRIIPARAGFTPTAYVRSSRPWDHPRSRGVYWRSASSWTPACGSSPLARGLPGRKRRAGHLRGIIPARAGFTSRLAS